MCKVLPSLEHSTTCDTRTSLNCNNICKMKHFTHQVKKRHEEAKVRQQVAEVPQYDLWPALDLLHGATAAWQVRLDFFFKIVLLNFCLKGDLSEWLCKISLSTQSHLTTCYASHHYITGRVILAEGIGKICDFMTADCLTKVKIKVQS